MIEWLSKKRSDDKRKEIQEQELKKSLSKKLSEYESQNNEAKDDFTELVVNGKKLRVAKEQITLTSGKPDK
jgi:hypothetical protein